MRLIRTRESRRLVRRLSYWLPRTRWLHRLCKLYLDNYYGDNNADKILEVLDTRGVASPLFHQKGRAMARGDFSRSLALKYVNDQLHMVMNAARLVGLSLPAAESASKVYQAGVDAGLGEEDFSAVIKVLRK